MRLYREKHQLGFEIGRDLKINFPVERVRTKGDSYEKTKTCRIACSYHGL